MSDPLVTMVTKTYFARRGALLVTVIAFSDDDDGVDLDARLPELGQPSGHFDRTRFHEDRHGSGPGHHRGRRVARCIEGHRVYLKRNPHHASSHREERDEHGFHWVHFPGEQDCAGHAPASPSESQEHKILKARAVVAFRSAGNDPVRTEVNGTNRGYRSDVQFQRPDGSRFALEIQVSGIDAVTARRRTDLTRRDGIEPLWLTSRADEDWQQLVPCVRLIRPLSGDTRQLRIEQVELFVTGTVEPYWEPCDNSRGCWRRRLHGTSTCPEHLRWRTTTESAGQVIDEVTTRYIDTAQMLGIDTFAERITRGELVIAHTARDDRRGTFPVISTPTARVEALDYARELQQWREHNRRAPRLSPATAYCTQPDHSPADDHNSPTAQDAIPPPWQPLRARACELARARGVWVRPVPNPSGLLEQLQLPGTRLVRGELLLVATHADRKTLTEGGIDPHRIAVAADPTTTTAPEAA